MKQIAILGSTGSIGKQALDVIASHPDEYEVYALTANNSVDLLIEQALRFKPEAVVIANEQHYPKLKEALSGQPVKVYAGADAINQIVTAQPIDIVLASMVGFAGLCPTIEAIKAGKVIALANKETMVVAGELVTSLALQYKTPILPVDSEHSAIFQCLSGEMDNPVEKILLTASGGPFRTLGKDQLAIVTKAQALKHPNWDMGAKITVDSATMMNKGLEIIEAAWLFDTHPDDIEVVVHRESIIHSMIEFTDHSILAQLGLPDMRIPIQYAITYPQRYPSLVPEIDWTQLSQMTFYTPDDKTFKCLAACKKAMKLGGLYPAVANGANEAANLMFRQHKIGFLDVGEIVSASIESIKVGSATCLDDVLAADAQAREFANKYFAD